jgi:FtsZ-binding cell division protein ZapB
MGDRTNNGRFALALITSLTPLVGVAAGLAPMVLTAPALGDVTSVTPYYAVVTAEKTSAHCGSNDRFYRVGELTSGQVVLVDGEGDAWSRISYPSQLTAFVRVEDVKVEGGNATLTTASKLKASNAASGYTGSWKALMDAPLPVGTTLKVIEPAKEGDVVVGYKIAAPESARAFVESRALRRATDSEVETFKTKGTVPALPAKPTTPETTPIKPTTPVTPGGQPDASKPSTPTPTPTGPVVITPDSKDAKIPAVPAKPEERVVGTYERLEETFNTVWKQPVLTSEVGELQAEFQRAADAAKGKPELQKALQARIDALKLRVDFREKLRKQQEARDALNKNKSQLEEEVAAWEKTRVYTIVGELQPSTVYDGKRLPLMYRVVSVGGSPRTLGYLKESKDTDLTKMIGQVIGVIGDSTLDRSLMLNIIDPIKVVTLKEAQPAKETKDAPTAGVEEKGDEGPVKKTGGY